MSMLGNPLLVFPLCFCQELKGCSDLYVENMQSYVCMCGLVCVWLIYVEISPVETVIE